MTLRHFGILPEGQTGGGATGCGGGGWAQSGLFLSFFRYYFVGGVLAGSTGEDTEKGSEMVRKKSRKVVAETVISMVLGMSKPP